MSKRLKRRARRWAEELIAKIGAKPDQKNIDEAKRFLETVRLARPIDRARTAAAAIGQTEEWAQRVADPNSVLPPLTGKSALERAIGFVPGEGSR